MELFGLDKDLTRKVLGYIADTNPYLPVQEDIEMFLMNMKDGLSDDTMQILEKEKESILELAKAIKESFGD